MRRPSPLLLLLGIGVLPACTAFDGVSVGTAEAKKAEVAGGTTSTGAACSDCTTAPVTSPSLTPTATDGIKNGDETDIDCGGDAAPKCADAKACNVPTDCQSGICTANACTDVQTISTATLLNKAAASINAAAGASSLAINPTASVAFTVGQTVIVHQTRGAGAGTWEQNKISALDPVASVLTLATPLAHAYSSVDPAKMPETNRAQIVGVEELGKVRVAVGGSLTAPAWDGTTGGILAIHATTLTIDTPDGITMAGKGYRGGVADDWDATSTTIMKQQGESYPGLGGSCVAALFVNCTFGANGGGGGGGLMRKGNDGSAGGGGGHATAGTAGGSNNLSGGAAGATYGDTALTSLFFGSGGGAALSADPKLGSGGAGGGIVLVDADTISLGVASAIDVAGAAGAAESSPNGGGGGGAGGTVRLVSSAVIDVTHVAIGGGVGGVGRTTGGAGGQGRVVSLVR